MGELDGRVAIITGAGRLRGIGRACAVALAGLGADVVVTGTGRDPATFPPDEKAVSWRDVESTADQVRELGRRALTLIADVSDSGDVQAMVDRTLEEFGRVDILINNAAFARGPDRVPILDLDDDIFQKVVDIKIGGTYLCTKAVARELIRQGEGGKIVNVSSTAGKRGSPNTLAYNAANFAVVGMTQSMARELGPLRHKRQLRLPRRRGHAPHGRRGQRRGVGGAGERHPHRQERHRRGDRRVHGLPLHGGGLMDSGPVDQPQRRHCDGALGESPSTQAQSLPGT